MAATVQPADMVLMAAPHRGAFSNDHINSILRVSAGGKRPRVSSGISGAGKAANTAANREPDMHMKGA